MNDLYVFNNPWSIQANEKHTTLLRDDAPRPQGAGHVDAAAEGLRADGRPAADARRATRASSTSAPIGAQIGYPLFMKPYDGGGWVGVSKVDDEAALRAAYDASGTKLMHLQAAVHPVRALRALHRPRAPDTGRELRSRRAAARPLPHGPRLRRRRAALPSSRTSRSPSTRSSAGTSTPARRCCATASGTRSTSPTPARTRRSPRCTTTSRGSSRRTCAGRSSAPRPAAACATTSTGRPTSRSPRQDLPYREKLRALRARSRDSAFDTEAFGEFCARHLGHLDAVADEFFGTEQARDAVRQKVTALFPAHEVDEFTELFYGRIQQWRAAEGRPG